ncbi:MAG TPA: efflux RND transporter periplasmic adaptor subunit [Verrucomicrobiae bacterium]|jgi:multidrug efflux pump subunit AcrA (membrane-fusion protein)|nr:efflux RND transporter periplasmic adaptor subunit [Verrucomicrobiae bacterium]
MTKTISILVLATALTAVAIMAGCSKGPVEKAATAPKEKTLYTCGMHPQVIQDHPGNCPICGMKLTPILKTSEASAANMSQITISPGVVQNMNIRTATVRRGPLRKTIHSVGTIEHNEAATTQITTKFKGWIEKLYVNTTGQHVEEGEPLFEIYSPELYSAQNEYVLALSLPDSGGELKASARSKLKFFDVSDEQIAELEKTREPRKTLQVLAPASGYVMDKMVTQGQMVDAGMKLYEIADHSAIWVLAQVYEQDLPFVQPGQEATLTVRYWPGKTFSGQVSFVYPTLDEKTRTATARLELPNPGHMLRPGMFASVEITPEMKASSLLVPDSAVLRSGEKNTVFVALPGGRFEPRTVSLGLAGENGEDEVLSGLNEGETIVTSGQFMLDSESQLREAIEKMAPPAVTNSMAIHPH